MALPALLLLAATRESRITALDWLTIAIYFGILLCVATWVVRRAKDSAADYFLAGRNLGWWGIGGSVFGTLFPEMTINIGGVIIDSFWIGSVLVIVLTGLYTTLGGMRAVAYNDAVQVTVLILGAHAAQRGVKAG